MIRNNESLSMAEAMEYIKKTQNEEIEIMGFIKKLVKITPKEAKEIRKNITELELIKVKPQHISKIIDLMPENAEDLNKIFTDVSLNEDETKQILSKIKLK
jgi:DNA-directed RNA polymerase subunit F